MTQAQKDEPHMLFHLCTSQLQIFCIVCLIGCTRESQESGPSSEIYLGSEDSSTGKRKVEGEYWGQKGSNRVDIVGI